MAAGNSRTIIMTTEFRSNSADNSGGAVYTDDTATVSATADRLKEGVGWGC